MLFHDSKTDNFQPLTTAKCAKLDQSELPNQRRIAFSVRGIEIQMYRSWQGDRIGWVSVLSPALRIWSILMDMKKPATIGWSGRECGGGRIGSAGLKLNGGRRWVGCW
jgi:hypothetical protein